MKARSTVFASLMLLLLAVIAGCEKNPDSSYNPPADHTTNMGGYMHKSGLGQPLTNCAGCHGSDLKGGTSGVSCFECHGTKW